MNELCISSYLLKFAFHIFHYVFHVIEVGLFDVILVYSLFMYVYQGVTIEAEAEIFPK